MYTQMGTLELRSRWSLEGGISVTSVFRRLRKDEHHFPGKGGEGRGGGKDMSYEARLRLVSGKNSDIGAFCYPNPIKGWLPDFFLLL